MLSLGYQFITVDGLVYTFEPLIMHKKILCFILS